MGNAMCRRGEPFIPGLVLDQVVAGTSPDSDCILYSLANFRKGGILVESFNKGGSKGVRIISYFTYFSFTNLDIINE